MAFVGITIPADIGKILNKIDVEGKKENIEELHVTILNLGDDFSIKNLTKALEATYEVCKNISPFTITMKQVICFPSQDDKLYPIVAEVESAELHSLHKKLSKSFDKYDIEYSKKFKEYKPHITLSYSKNEIEEFKLKEKLKVRINEITLWGGNQGQDKIFITFPLDVEQKKSSCILQISNIFYKLAHNNRKLDKLF